MKYQRIKDLREDYDLTQDDVAEILHVAQRTYSHYETGSHNIPIEALYLLSDFYDVSVDYLTGRSDKKKPDEVSDNSKNAVYPASKPPALLVSEAKAQLKQAKRAAKKKQSKPK